MPFIKNFISKLKLYNDILDKTIQFSLNIDGLPFKNSSSSVWPIFAIIDSYVFPLAMTYGSKPSNLLFLNDIVHCG